MNAFDSSDESTSSFFFDHLILKDGAAVVIIESVFGVSLRIELI